MAARAGAPACQAQLYRALTDWFLARRDVRAEEKMEGKRAERREGRERWGGEVLVNDEDSVRGEKAGEWRWREDNLKYKRKRGRQAAALRDDTEVAEFICLLSGAQEASSCQACRVDTSCHSSSAIITEKKEEKRGGILVLREKIFCRFFKRTNSLNVICGKKYWDAKYTDVVWRFLHWGIFYFF